MERPSSTTQPGTDRMVTTRRSGRARFRVVRAGAVAALAGLGLIAAACAPPVDPPTTTTTTSTTTTTTLAPAACSPGTFSATDGNEPCEPAPAGTFVATMGATSATPCPVGFFQPNTASTSCLAAPLGFYVDVTGSTTSTPAPAGTFVDNVGSASATPCAVGSYQPNTASTSCLLAPIGFYVATVGAASATACPAGTTTPFIGAISVSDCSVVLVPSFTFDRVNAPVVAGNAPGLGPAGVVNSNPFALSVTFSGGYSASVTVPCVPSTLGGVYIVVWGGSIPVPANSVTPCGSPFTVSSTSSLSFAASFGISVGAVGIDSSGVTTALPPGTPITFTVHGGLGTQPTIVL